MSLLPIFFWAALLPTAHVSDIPPAVREESPIRISDAAVRLKDAAGERVFFRLEGKITTVVEDRFVLRDSSRAVLAMVSCDDPWHVGDNVRMVATATPNTYGEPALFVEALAIEVLAHGMAEAPARVTPPALSSGDLGYRPVSLEGVVTDAFRDEVDPAWNVLVVEADGGRTAVWLKNPDMRQPALDALVDSVVRVDGVCLPYHNGSRRYLRPWVHAVSRDAVHVTAPARADPFDVEDVQDGAIEAMPRLPRRRRMSGTVVAVWRGRHLFLRDDAGKRIEVSLRRGSELPPVDSRVTVSGFVRRDIFYTKLANALLRIDALRAPDVPKDLEDVTARGMLFSESGELHMRPSLNGRLIRIAGKVRDIYRSDGRLVLDCDGIQVPVLFGEDVIPPERGSEIAVVGACLAIVESGDDAESFTRMGGFAVIPRGQADINIVRRPPWWTPQRLLAVIGALVLALAAILAWNASLRTLAERRGREAFREQMARLKATMKVEERTRLAVELHDSISQTLTGIALLVDSAAKANDEGNAAANRYLGTVRQMLASCRRELQGCLWDLRSRTFEEKNMAEAVMRTISPNVGDAEVTCRFNVPRQALSEVAAHAALRIIRELVMNAVGHGKATHVRIAGEYRDGLLRFSVRDDGGGFDPATARGPAQGHFGLRGIAERIKAFNGDFSLESALGKGTKASVTMDVRGKECDGRK